MEKPDTSRDAGQKQAGMDELLHHPIIRNLGEMFSHAGHELYLVGGSVRDALVGRSHDDFDFATSASPEETLSVIRGFADNIWQVGIAFGTIGFSKAQCKLEVTTFRQETYPEDSRHPQVSFEATIETDLSRRDFTVNAMAVKIPEGTFVDPFNGISDLAAGRLSTPLGAEQSFTDDPLRMLRAVRFMGSLGITLDEEIVDVIGRLGNRLSIVSKERIRDEISKLLMTANPGPALMAMVNTGLAEHIIPELSNLALLRDPSHLHKDVLKHTLQVVANTPPDLDLRLAALFHDIGKPKTKTVDEDGVHFFHHEVVGAKMASRRLKELRFPVKMIEKIKALINFHMRFHTYRLGWTDKAVRKYVREVGPENIALVGTLVRADCTTQNPALAQKYSRLLDELEKRVDVLEAQEASADIRPPIDGKEIMDFLHIGPGPTVGKVLGMLLEARLEGRVRTKKEAFALTKEWVKENL